MQAAISAQYTAPNESLPAAFTAYACISSEVSTVAPDGKNDGLVNHTGVSAWPPTTATCCCWT